MKKRLLIPYLLLATAVFIALGLFFRTHKLQNEVNQYNVAQKNYAKKVHTFEKLVAKDSILLSGNHQKAISEYQKIAKELGFDNLGIELRIALAEQLQEYSENNLDVNNIAVDNDSLSPEPLATPKELERYDSLSFAHEKAKIQLNRIQKLLQEKSFGEYLTFKSKKGNQMHYVGQVRNGKANGYGIALLDTGSRYEGEWSNNQRHGEGTFYWPDGEYYVGSYVNAQRSGYGTYYWPNGEKYSGNWKDDKRNGEGEFYSANGEILTSGFWENDKLVQAEKRERKTRR